MSQLDDIQSRTDDPFGTMKLGIGQVDADRDYLLALVREQAAQLETVGKLAAGRLALIEVLVAKAGEDK